MTVTGGPRACINGDRLEAIAGHPAPGRPDDERTTSRCEQAADNPDRLWCMSEVDIFCDLNEQEMEAMAQAAPMRPYPAGSLVFSPHQPVEALFILKKGRIRIFRVSEDGRALPPRSSSRERSSAR